MRGRENSRLEGVGQKASCLGTGEKTNSLQHRARFPLKPGELPKNLAHHRHFAVTACYGHCLIESRGQCSISSQRSIAANEPRDIIMMRMGTDLP